MTDLVPYFVDGMLEVKKKMISVTKVAKHAFSYSLWQGIVWRDFLLWYSILLPINCTYMITKCAILP